ncbi:aldehyde dehydrogenase family protein [Rhodococcus sp. (in: high G+C Gram-positive bacteria)]|uniref:aldehyde dehydrogenase family protein n=1 Tax=Rhodococcus sp. TaxID=1831 RepID=UPI00257B5FC1|nr:aldehyde dehydrogenase family protein [Rhodococcus sp. (in: high G+C Gram-positive bacteria)]
MSHYIGLLDTFEFERVITPVAGDEKAHRIVRREGAGVVAAITPWNYPFHLALGKLVPALAAGCTVVLKPAPDTPWNTLEIGRILLEHTDIPAGVVPAVTRVKAVVSHRGCWCRVRASATQWTWLWRLCRSSRGVTSMILPTTWGL